MDKRCLATAFLWLWVAGAFAAYAYQFRGFVDPVLDVLGFK